MLLSLSCSFRFPLEPDTVGFCRKALHILFYHHFSGSTRENGANGQFFRLIYQFFAERRVSSLIGAKRGKTAAQTALRFLMQSGIVVIPKSVHKERMQQNFDLFDFTLTAEDMTKACTTPRRASGS